MDSNKDLILDYIETIWNQQDISLITDYVTDDFIDHSLPTGIPANGYGTKMWITATGRSFRHHTVVDDILLDTDKVCIRIHMNLQHVGDWRGYTPTNAHITTIGYRLFTIRNGRIAEQWALIDGNVIEQAIIGYTHTCRVQN